MCRAVLMGIPLAVVLVGCARQGDSRPAGALLDVPAALGSSAPLAQSESVVRTCAVPEPRGQPTAVGHLLHSAEVASRSYYLGVGKSGEDVLVRLGPRGELIQTPVPARTENVTRERASLLRFLADGKPPRWFTIDLSSPDAPGISAATPAPDMEHKGTLKAFASDGERAMVGRYMVDYDAKPTRYYGETALHSVPDGKRTSPVVPVTAWSGACRQRRCVAAASGEGLAVPIELYGIQDSGAEKLAELDGECMGWADWVDGERWIVARPVKPGFELIAVELGSWRVSKKRVPLALQCPWVRHAELGGRSGILFGPSGAELSFLPVSGALAVGEPEPLPKASSGEQELAPMPDGALLLVQRIGHGMMHSPTDRAVRRYFHVWSFDGHASLLRPQTRSHAWRAEALVPLPHSGEEGQFSDGYRARGLVRPGFAAVVVDDRPGGKSELVVIGRPCAAKD